LPASGFQSVQYRLIELASTSAQQLLDVEFKPFGHKLTLEEKLEKIYWRKGSTELSTGKKTLTLQRFEQKYNGQILSFAKDYETKNVGTKIKEINWSLEENQGLKKVLRTLDEQANILWPLAHFHSAMRYLNKPPAVLQATGGTNWQRYLPPKFQKTVFFPELWTEEELENWGKTAFQKATVKPF
jgi:tryptophan 2,3-dioxygenase